MTQISRPQNGRLGDGFVDAGGYNAQQWARVYNIITMTDETTQGVAVHLNNLAVTNPTGTTIRVASGAALVRGHAFFNEDQTTPSADSNVDFAPSTPAADRIDRVVLVQNNTDASYDTNLQFPTDLTNYGGTASVPGQTCRLAILTGVEGGAMRSLVQDAALVGNIWMIEIARYTITSAPAISSMTDQRQFVPAIATENLDDDAVTTDKVANDSITTTKIPNRPRHFLVSSTAGNTPSETVQGLVFPSGSITGVAGWFAVPTDYAGGMTVSAIVRGESAGDVDIVNTANFGEEGEPYNENTETDTGTVSVTTNTLLALPLTLSGITADDIVNLTFSRVDIDPLADDLYFAGWLVEYTADS